MSFYTIVPTSLNQLSHQYQEHDKQKYYTVSLVLANKLDMSLYVSVPISFYPILAFWCYTIRAWICSSFLFILTNIFALLKRHSLQSWRASFPFSGNTKLPGPPIDANLFFYARVLLQKQGAFLHISFFYKGAVPALGDEYSGVY